MSCLLPLLLLLPILLLLLVCPLLLLWLLLLLLLLWLLLLWLLLLPYFIHAALPPFVTAPACPPPTDCVTSTSRPLRYRKYLKPTWRNGSVCAFAFRVNACVLSPPSIVPPSSELWRRML